MQTTLRSLVFWSLAAITACGSTPPTGSAAPAASRNALDVVELSALTVPIGDTRGLPLGLAFMGAAYSEGDLIGFGFALERKLQARRQPQYKPTLESR
jgi:amidase